MNGLLTLDNIKYLVPGTDNFLAELEEKLDRSIAPKCRTRQIKKGDKVRLTPSPQAGAGVIFFFGQWVLLTILTRACSKVSFTCLNNKGGNTP